MNEEIDYSDFLAARDVRIGDANFEEKFMEYKRERSVLFRQNVQEDMRDLGLSTKVHGEPIENPFCPQPYGDVVHNKGTRTDVCPSCRKYNAMVQDVGRSKTDPEDQPMPVKNDHPYVHDLVAQDIAARGELGKRRYGTKLQPFNGRNALQDAYEEILDAAVYLKQAMIEEERIPTEPKNGTVRYRDGVQDVYVDGRWFLITHERSRPYEKEGE